MITNTVYRRFFYPIITTSLTFILNLYHYLHFQIIFNIKYCIKELENCNIQLKSVSMFIFQNKTNDIIYNNVKIIYSIELISLPQLPYPVFLTFIIIYTLDNV